MPIFETVKLSSYGEGTTSSRNVKISKDLDRSIEGKRVLIIEDIIDTGNTLAWFNKPLESKGAIETEIVCLLNKQSRREVDVDVAYTGFEIEDHFVVGYGMDLAEEFRSLPCVCIMKTD